MRFIAFLLTLLCALSAIAQQGSTLESVLRELRESGADVIYSSELVTPEMRAPVAAAKDTPLQKARAALAANGLALRQLGPKTWVVIRLPPPAQAELPDEPLDEISVYASRYAIDGGLAEHVIPCSREASAGTTPGRASA